MYVAVLVISYWSMKIHREKKRKCRKGEWMGTFHLTGSAQEKPIRTTTYSYLTSSWRMPLQYGFWGEKYVCAFIYYVIHWSSFRSIDATGLELITKNLQAELSAKLVACREKTSMNLEACLRSLFSVLLHAHTWEQIGMLTVKRWSN